MRIRLKELVENLGGQLIGDADIQVEGIAPLEDASASQISFLSNSKLRAALAQTRAAAVVLSAEEYELAAPTYLGACIITAKPYVYFARAAQFFAAKNAVPAPIGVHSSAHIDTTAYVAATAYIAENVVIGAGAVIGEHVQIGAGCVIGPGVMLGDASLLYPHVTIYADCQIGRRTILHAGVVIGADGFGFANDAGVWVKIPQKGRVVIGDDVEIGANTTIDRGALADTVIEEGVKLDNQIQIAHNCHIGAHTAIAACVGIAGSATIGKYCSIGGAAMIHGHIKIADHVHVSAGTLALSSISEAGQYTGFYPIAKHHEWEKSAVLLRNLQTMREKIRSLEKSVQQLIEKNNE